MNIFPKLHNDQTPKTNPHVKDIESHQEPHQPPKKTWESEPSRVQFFIQTSDIIRHVKKNDDNNNNNNDKSIIEKTEKNPRNGPATNSNCCCCLRFPGGSPLSSAAGSCAVQRRAASTIQRAPASASSVEGVKPILRRGVELEMFSCCFCDFVILFLVGFIVLFLLFLVVFGSCCNLLWLLFIFLVLSLLVGNWDDVSSWMAWILYAMWFWASNIHPHPQIRQNPLDDPKYTPTESEASIIWGYGHQIHSYSFSMPSAFQFI